MTWMMMTVMCLLLIAGYPMMMPLLAATVLAFLIYFPNLGIQQIVQQMIGGVNYERIDEKGLHITHGPTRERAEILDVDTVVLCAGQVPERALSEGLTAAGIAHHLIGGADVAAELDAKRAIDQAARLAARL